jgi:putative transposase
VPRPNRVFPPNSVLHVVNRGNERRRLFEGGPDYDSFLSILRRNQRRHEMRVLAYVLMPNHWHLVLWPECHTALWQFMHGLTGAHAARIRHATSTRGLGHVYQRRYYSAPLEADERYVVTLRYVEANPVRAHLVERAQDWHWSSLRERIIEPDIITTGPLPLPDVDAWVALVNAQPQIRPEPTRA